MLVGSWERLNCKQCSILPSVVAKVWTLSPVGVKDLSESVSSTSSSLSHPGRHHRYFALSPTYASLVICTVWNVDLVTAWAHVPVVESTTSRKSLDGQAQHRSSPVPWVRVRVSFSRTVIWGFLWLRQRQRHALNLFSTPDTARCARYHNIINRWHLHNL